MKKVLSVLCIITLFTGIILPSYADGIIEPNTTYNTTIDNIYNSVENNEYANETENNVVVKDQENIIENNSINEIIEYAKEQLEKGDDRIEICELAGSSDYDLEDVMDTLYELAKEEKNPDDLEDRKLRAARVNKFLKDKNTNCIDGLMGLTELWLELGCTADSPHIIQGKDNSISPVEYYTDANYNYLYEKNKHWLKDEVYFLIHNEK